MSTVTCFVDCNRQTVVKGAPLGFYRYIGGRIAWKRFDMTHSKKRKHLCCRKMLLIIDKAETETTGLTVFGAAPDPEVQQLIFLWIWPLSGVIAKPNPQTSPWPCHLTSKSDVHFYFNRTEADCTKYIPLFFVRDLQFIYCFSFSRLISVRSGDFFELERHCCWRNILINPLSISVIHLCAYHVVSYNRQQ